ncbi:pentapeptide repeat-containing protein [Nocardia nova SH22a]|uniref:Pentapeptide repeat-containing protein n=1 Tax=Nocardia nova SH22a TaxID=1415166 RepID=W5TM39_9NOCA|nr:pentapeptide repeat-containing protein [Nocardia nova]AHH18316.1 pentapeptide repeat-containing protein [Nocardia nova SH22a]
MPQRPRYLFTVLIAAICLVGIVVVLYRIPVWQAEPLLDRLDAKDRLAAEATLRGPLVPLLVALAGFGTLSYTARKFLLERANHHIDRLHTAVGDLESDNSVTREGGAAELQSIMQDAPAYRARVRSILAHFLRNRTTSLADASDMPAGDIAAILDVLRIRPRRRDRRHPERPLNLTGIRIPRGDFSDMPLANASLAHADLNHANLRGTSLSGACLRQANLIGADLTDADLRGADLTGARLTNAVLGNADLTGADLDGVIGLTAERLAAATTDGTTRLPDRIPKAAQAPAG